MVAVVSEVSQIMFNPVGMRIRMSSAALTSADAASVMVMVVMAVAASLTPKVWAEEEMESGRAPPFTSSSETIPLSGLSVLFQPKVPAPESPFVPQANVSLPVLAAVPVAASCVSVRPPLGV